METTEKSIALDIKHVLFVDRDYDTFAQFVSFTGEDNSFILLAV